MALIRTMDSLSPKDGSQFFCGACGYVIVRSVPSGSVVTHGAKRPHADAAKPLFGATHRGIFFRFRFLCFINFDMSLRAAR